MASTTGAPLVAVLDMGASAIRLVVAEIDARRAVRDHRRGVARRAARPRHVLGRRRSAPQTVDAALAALDGFRADHGRLRRRATSAPSRRARSARRATATCSSTASAAAPASRSRSSTRPRRAASCTWPCGDALGGTPAFKRRPDAARRGRRRQHQPDAAAPRPADRVRRLRARRGPAAPAARPPAPHATSCRWRCSSATSPTSSRKSALEIPLDRVTHMIAIGGDVRFAASQLTRQRRRRRASARSPREQFLAFCDEVERLDEDGLVDRFRLPAVEAETLLPALLVYRTLLSETAARSLVVSRRVAAGRRAARRRRARRPARAPRTSSSRCWPAPTRSASATASIATHGRHVAMLADAAVRRSCATSTASAIASGCCCRSPRCCTTSASTSACARITSTRSTSCRRRRSSGCPNDETAIVSNIARYHRRGLPQKSHLPYIALDRTDRLIVNKLAAILRVANALDAEHAAEGARTCAWSRRDSTWVLELDGDRRPDDGAAGGDRARRHVRRDLRPPARDPAGGSADVTTPATPSRAVHQPRAVVAGVQRARARGGGRPGRRRCSSASSSRPSPPSNLDEFFMVRVAGAASAPSRTTTRRPTSPA